MDRSDASALADLQMHWDEAYTIGLDGDIWSARFHGSADDLRAHTSTELRELIRADYAYRQQVSRVRATAVGTTAVRSDDDDLDDDYTVHFDGARGADPDGGHQNDAEPDRQTELSHGSLPRGGYENLRGERMST